MEREGAEDVEEAVDEGQPFVGGGLAHEGVVLVGAESPDDVEEDADGDEHEEDDDPQARGKGGHQDGERLAVVPRVRHLQHSHGLYFLCLQSPFHVSDITIRLILQL